MPTFSFFVAYRFSDKDKQDLKDTINEAFKRTGLRPYFADHDIGQNYILTKIEETIQNTAFGIYDITNMNVNVCMELGFARGAKKRHYVIMKRGQSIPADLQGLQRIEFDTFAELRNQLKEVARIEKERMEEINAVVTDSEIYDHYSKEEIHIKRIALYQAEDMFHRFGHKVPDSDAVNGFAWKGDLSEGYDQLVFGPYQALPDLGEYVIFYRIKIDNNVICEPVLLLDAIGGTDIASRVLYGINFTEANQYKTFGLEFISRDRSTKEYRIGNHKRVSSINCKVWVDNIAVVKKADLHAL